MSSAPNAYPHKNRQAIFTISDADYAVMALTLFDSVSRFYKDSDLFLFVIGTGEVKKLEGDVHVVYIGDVLDDLDLSQRLAYYLQVELATSVRPQCFEFLFAKDYDKAIYLDPDLYIFRRMTEVDDLLNGSANGVVTPHSLQSTSSEVQGGDRIFLQCGIFNLGFLALKNTAETKRMVAWWSEKLKWKCIVDWRNGYFVDQKWLEFLPVFFDGFHILKLPTYNLAPWNSEHYEILNDLNNNFFINNFSTPVAFIHFSGVKRSERHFTHMKKAYHFYLSQLEKRKFTKLDFSNYQTRFTENSLYLDKVCIFLYKDYVNNTKDIQSNPLVDKKFYDFIHSIDNETKLPIYIRKLYEILPDIFVGYLPRKLEINFDNLITLIKEYFPYDGVVSLETMIQLRNDSINSSHKIRNTNSIKSDKNITEAQAPNNIHINGIPLYKAAIDSFCNNEQQHKSGAMSSLRQAIFQSDRVEIIDGTIRVCMPHINESGALPTLHDIKRKHYTEIWVPSEYCKKKLLKRYGLSNVTAIPYPVLRPTCKIQETGLPNNKFIVMLLHDFNLDFEKQNPLASLKAFQEAFAHRNDVLLICFLSNVKQSKDYENLLAAFHDEKNAKIIKETPDTDLYYSYLHRAHCFISLHRETVFGYALAQAMSLGKYIIATNDGGNTDYMNSDNSFMVGSASAKECVFEAAKILTTIYHDTNVLGTKSKQAKLYVQKYLSPNSVGFIMQKRLEMLHSLETIHTVRPSLFMTASKKLYGLLRPFLIKIPLFVRIYLQLKKIKGKFVSESGDASLISERDQIAMVMAIILKSAHRPEILE